MQQDSSATERPLISIIVPIYRAERYLRKCLDSIVSQTYRALDIILVDDGSPDRCGEICEEYAANDSRIRVIHKGNGGVSSARNAGLTAAAGEWIGWVDPDDWIETDMFEYLLKGAVSAGAEIAVCSRYEVYEDKRIFRGWEREIVLNTGQAVEALLTDDQMQNYLWDKLWKRELFDGVVFPEGRTFEDMAVMYRMFERAKWVACLPGGKYNYFQHPGSIVRKSTLNNRINYYTAIKERLDDMRKRWPQFEGQLEAQCIMASVSIWGVYLSAPREEREFYRSQIEEISAAARECGENTLRHVRLGILGRAILRLVPYPAWWSFALARFFGWVYRVRRGRAI